jgi:endonuclease/exonuclease/phosphatase family metal-dependent hydrolase
MGDLNCSADAREDTLDILCEGLQLDVYEREDHSIVTYPRTRRRLDWILVSRDLEFHHHAVLPETISDHQAVLAVVAPRSTDEA